MRIIALLSLIIGFLWQLLLDGQTFTHAVGGIICGALAMACGVVSARKEHANAARRWEGRIMASLGLLLAVACVVLLPSAYRFQFKFNERRSVLPQVQEPTQNGLEQAPMAILRPNMQRCNLFGVGWVWVRFPRVGAWTRQPWVKCFNPFGIVGA